MKEADKKMASGPVEEGAIWTEHGGSEIAHALQYLDVHPHRGAVPTHTVRTPSTGVSLSERALSVL